MLNKTRTSLIAVFAAVMTLTQGCAHRHAECDRINAQDNLCRIMLGRMDRLYEPQPGVWKGSEGYRVYVQEKPTVIELRPR